MIVRTSEAWILAGADVATPNKRAGSGPFTRYACRACAASIALMLWSSGLIAATQVGSNFKKGRFFFWIMVSQSESLVNEHWRYSKDDFECTTDLYWLINGQEKIAAASKKTGARFLYEATAGTLGHGAWHVGNFWLRISSSKVGAGLPVIGPLQALVRADDEVETASSQVKI